MESTIAPRRVRVTTIQRRGGCLISIPYAKKILIVDEELDKLILYPMGRYIGARVDTEFTMSIPFGPQTLIFPPVTPVKLTIASEPVIV